MVEIHDVNDFHEVVTLETTRLHISFSMTRYTPIAGTVEKKKTQRGVDVFLTDAEEDAKERVLSMLEHNLFAFPEERVIAEGKVINGKRIYLTKLFAGNRLTTVDYWAVHNGFVYSWNFMYPSKRANTLHDLFLSFVSDRIVHTLRFK